MGLAKSVPKMCKNVATCSLKLNLPSINPLSLCILCLKIKTCFVVKENKSKGKLWRHTSTQVSNMNSSDYYLIPFNKIG